MIAPEQSTTAAAKLAAAERKLLPAPQDQGTAAVPAVTDGFVPDGRLRLTKPPSAHGPSGAVPSVTAATFSLNSTFFPRSSSTVVPTEPRTTWERRDRTTLDDLDQTVPEDAAPPHLSILQTLQDKYPRLATRMVRLETDARDQNFTPFKSAQIEAQVLANPPWSTQKYPKRETEWLQHLRQTQPQLLDAADFNEVEAAMDCARLAWELNETFPAEKYPDIAAAARVKDVHSLDEKLQRMRQSDPGYTLANVPDTVAGRVDTPDLQSLGEATRCIESRFDGRILAKMDYISQPGKNGYRAIHYIVDYGKRAVEIQVTTRNFRTADLATHDTVYKDAEGRVPSNIKEQFLRLSSMAMLVDGLSYLLGLGKSP